MAIELSCGPRSGLSRLVSNLRHAVEAFEARNQDRLFRGELIEDLPEEVRCRLMQSRSSEERSQGG